MNKKNCILIIIMLIVFASCKKEINNNEPSTILIELERTDPVSFFDIFSKAEIIKIETNDTLLIRYVDKVQIYEDKLYVFDFSTAQVISFNFDGSFNYKIRKIGHGPNEYTQLSDFEVYNDSLFLMSLMDKTMHIYDLDGNFARRVRLPDIIGNYRNIKHLNKDTIAFWTFDDENRLKFYSKSTNTIFKEIFPEESSIYNKFSTPVFPSANYFVRPFNNKVMQFSADAELIAAYEWDFGALNNNVDAFLEAPVVTDENSHKELWDFAKKIYSSEIVNYFFGMSGGNSQYTYTQIMRKNRNVSIFYNKDTKQSYVFDKTVEGATIFPYFWTEEYVIGIVPEINELSIDDILPDKILDEKNKANKMKISKFDNPILIKYYFKK